MIDKYYYINLAVNGKRRKAMKDEFRKIGVEGHRFEALDGSKLDVVDLIEDGAWDRTIPLSAFPDGDGSAKGNLGCFLSHMYLWRHIVEHDRELDVVAIFEDDVQLNPSFMSDFARMFAQLDPDWELVKIGFNKFNDNGYTRAPTKEEMDSEVEVFSHIYPYGTWAYIVKVEMLGWLVEAFLPIGDEPKRISMDTTTAHWAFKNKKMEFRCFKYSLGSHRPPGREHSPRNRINKM